MTKRCSLVLSLLFVLPMALPAEDASKPLSGVWPQWRGPKRDGVSTEKGLLQQWPKSGPRLIWNSRQVNSGTGVGTGYSSVSVADGRIFTLGDRKRECLVIALDEDTGKELWATAIAPAQGDGPRCTPTVDDDRVYVLGREGELVCLGAQKGEIRWRKDFKRDFNGQMMSGWDYSESPLIDGDKLICTPGGDEAALVAVNKHTGELLWKAPVPKAGGAGYASPVVAEVNGIRQYITLLGRGIVGVGANDGRLLWRYAKIANGTANIPTPIVRGDLVFCSTGYNTGAALLQLVPAGSGITIRERYFHKGKVLQNHHGGMVLVGDHVYGGHGHNAGLPFCLNLKTGQFAWGPEHGPGDGSAAVVYADGNLYFRYQDGVMALIEANPDRYHVRSQFNLPKETGTPSWPHPVVAHGRLYIRGRDVLLCYDVKEK
jgi:outer membrane protein assembly factor BamB